MGHTRKTTGETPVALELVLSNVNPRISQKRLYHQESRRLDPADDHFPAKSLPTTPAASLGCRKPS